MPWQGNKDNMIDRFDVRAHLDMIPDHQSGPEVVGKEENLSMLNYERYRILIQNEATKSSFLKSYGFCKHVWNYKNYRCLCSAAEDKFLHQIHIEEQFGTTTGPGKHHKEPKSSTAKAAIGYTYEDSNPSGNTWSATVKDKEKKNADASEDESEEELDFGTIVYYYYK